MLVAALGFAIMGALVKIGAQKFSPAELVFYRSLFGLLSIWLFILLQKLPLATPYIGKHMSRALVGFTSPGIIFLRHRTFTFSDSHHTQLHLTFISCAIHAVSAA